jgi:rare lipoprotein A
MKSHDRSSGVRVAHQTRQSRPPTKASKVAKASNGGSLLTGIASVYSGEKTANGEYAHANGLTAAHRSLPFGTLVKVTNKQTGKSVVVRINDRGPYVHGRVIDLMPAASKAIGSSGLAPVSLAVVGRA